MNESAVNVVVLAIAVQGELENKKTSLAYIAVYIVMKIGEDVTLIC